ncbi:MAG TPA: hypothetical protein VNY77_01625 [Candidatus Angelobacter sp.]|nr:hypothetical protein [Candidatus Angelobacter sp.]
MEGQVRVPVAYWAYIKRWVTELPNGQEVEGTYNVSADLRTERPFQDGIRRLNAYKLQLEDGTLVGGVNFNKTDPTGTRHHVIIQGDDAEDLVRTNEQTGTGA